jgi:hypothetical protein
MTWGKVAGTKATEPMRIAGVDLRLFDPLESQGLTPEMINFWWGKVETFRDPALASWLLGVNMARLSGLHDFVLVRPKLPAARAWLIPSKGLEQADGMKDVQVLIDKFQRATPLPFQSDVPERAEVNVTVADQSPAMIVLSTTFDPEWRAWWSSTSVERRPAEVVKVLGGWQGVTVPEPGRWTLHLEYPGQAAKVGLAVSSLAWIVWVVALLRIGAKAKARAKAGAEPSSPILEVVEPEPEGGS